MIGKGAQRPVSRALATVWRALPTALQRLVVALSDTLYRVTVGAVVLDDEGRVVLLDHPFRGHRWGIPGGFVARREQPEDCIRREVREEVGLDLTHIELAYTRALIATAHIEIVFRARAGSHRAR